MWSKIVLHSRLELDPEGLNINEEFNISAEPVEEFKSREQCEESNIAF